MSDETYHVLVPVDTDDDRARAAAEAVTTLPGNRETITATVLHIFEPFRETSEGLVTDSDDIFEHADLPESVDIAVEILAAGIKTAVRKEYGDPSDEILAAADDVDADSIVMSGRRRSPTEKIIFGSISQSVLLNPTDRSSPRSQRNRLLPQSSSAGGAACSVSSSSMDFG